MIHQHLVSQPETVKYLRKTADVKKRLKDRCPKKNILFINHENYNSRHLNASKLYLYKKATQVLSNKFAEAISNVIN